MSRSTRGEAQRQLGLSRGAGELFISDFQEEEGIKIPPRFKVLFPSVQLLVGERVLSVE